MLCVTCAYLVVFIRRVEGSLLLHYVKSDRACRPTETFGADSTALQRVDGPVVVLQSVHQLQDGAHAADGGVDGGGADELRRQVGVEGQLDLCAHTTSNLIQTGTRDTYKSPQLARRSLGRDKYSLCVHGVQTEAGFIVKRQATKE